MKKLFLLFAFFGAVSFAANAQCSHAKSASAASTSVDAPGHCTASAAAKLASADASIETRTCPQTGKVSYMKKTVSAETGKATFTEVEYCSKSGKFVNVSPSEKAACSKSKAACSGDAKATKVSSTGGTGAACCAGAKAASASCCDKSKSSGAASTATTKKAATAKLVSNED